MLFIFDIFLFFLSFSLKTSYNTSVFSVYVYLFFDRKKEIEKK